MALHLTKIAWTSRSPEALRAWLEGHDGEARLTTRYLPKRHAELAGGSLFWIIEHTLVGRSPLIGFEQRAEDGRWSIRLEPTLIAVHPRRKRAHQGWRYLTAGDAPADLPDGATAEVLPPRLVGELARLGLV